MCRHLGKVLVRQLQSVRARRSQSRVAAGLGSMLRLQLVVELLRSPQGLRLEDAAQRTACPEGDVAACLR